MRFPVALALTSMLAAVSQQPEAPRCPEFDSSAPPPRPTETGSGDSTTETTETDAVVGVAPTSVTKTFAFPRVHSLTHEAVPHDYGAEDHRRKVAARREKAQAAKQARKHQAKLRRQRR